MLVQLFVVLSSNSTHFYISYANLLQVSGHSPENAGFIMLSGQLSDAIFNPLVGYLSDKTKSKYAYTTTSMDTTKLEN